MPELPEVETVRRGLAPVLEGQRIARAEVRRADLRFPFPAGFAERLSGRRVLTLGRRAKYLMLHLEGNEVMVAHLGMSGRFLIERPQESTRRTTGVFTHDTGLAAPHDHVVLETAEGVRITYNDPRRFGFMLLLEEAEVDRHPLFRGLGVEPLGNALDAGYLAALARGRRAELKTFLMDQRVIAGLGNIYVAEALHRARLSPCRAASCLVDGAGRPTRRAERLVPAIRAVLGDAIAAGGSTLRDHRQADGTLGYFQHQFLVYGREGEPCARPGCRGTVRRTIHAGRSTFHCPACQR